MVFYDYLQAYQVAYLESVLSLDGYFEYVLGLGDYLEYVLGLGDYLESILGLVDYLESILDDYHEVVTDDHPELDVTAAVN